LRVARLVEVAALIWRASPRAAQSHADRAGEVMRSSELDDRRDFECLLGLIDERAHWSTADQGETIERARPDG
jgi:hypothetical protein